MAFSSGGATGEQRPENIKNAQEISEIILIGDYC
jgi:hypothetical protein